MDDTFFSAHDFGDFGFFAVDLWVAETMYADPNSLYDAPLRAFGMMVIVLVPVAVIGIPISWIAGIVALWKRP